MHDKSPILIDGLAMRFTVMARLPPVLPGVQGTIACLFHCDKRAREVADSAVLHRWWGKDVAMP
ncbi:hypothetical protein RBI14_15185 [Alcaligenaceae bacterium B3P038]|nr:hypothetical protein [Alcaligenaceae bacterium B3P038]